MFKENAERRLYRRSPGRQYGYDYNPLREQEQIDTSVVNETWDGDGPGRKPSRPGGVLAPRPDPRRARQLMRQNILASKTRSTVLNPPGEANGEQDGEEQELEISQRAAYRSHRAAQPEQGYYPQRYREFEEEQIVEDWLKHGESVPDYMDPDLGYEEDPLEGRLRDAPGPAAARRTRVLDREDEDELLEAELAAKKRKASRRKFIVGAVAVGGATVAAYELLPRVPQAIGNGAANVEHQIQQAFSNGFTQGGEAVRKELINSLESLEGFSLEGAIEAARLTRVAYDVFVSPLVTLAATVADDFLTVTLDALITGRKWLAQINEDSPTLAALQTVLQSWVNQAGEMPKKIQAITDTDLDGAQNYLRALQRKIQEEQAQLTSSGTPTPTAQATPHATPQK